ncbi:MAG TPA: hypothetical protein VHD83_13695 [Puia sp.]|nr:hypothetical protein [Puia sp.]
MRDKKIMWMALLAMGMLSGRSGFSQTMSLRADTALLNFFTGRWSGEGAFSNGAKIVAEVSFSLSLDSSWLVYEHRDKLPNKWKATSYWGMDGVSGRFVAYCFDNFQGHRSFDSNGWKNGRLILSGQGWLPQIGLYFEHFIYERTGEKSFKMRYETSRDGISWQMGDWLEFRREG